MKKILLICVILIPLAGIAQRERFTLEGKIGNLDRPATVYLFYIGDGGMTVDSTVLKAGGFRFRGVVTGPTKVDLILVRTGTGIDRTRPLEKKTLYLDGGKVAINSADSLSNVAVTGSKLNDEMEQYQALFEGTRLEKRTIDREARRSRDRRDDTAFMAGIKARYKAVLDEKEAINRKYIMEHPDDYTSLLAMEDIANDNGDYSSIELLYVQLPGRIRATPQGQAIAKRILAHRSHTDYGAIAPDFTQNDANNRPVKLSDFRGKYVLLDFWASWCHPCRMENPNVVKAYNEYKDKNFTVLGVSLDQPGQRGVWLRAIEADGLTWTQVSDLNFWNNAVARLYGVQSIPANFLIDPNGKIVGINLRGAALDRRLRDLLN